MKLTLAIRKPDGTWELVVVVNHVGTLRQGSYPAYVRYQ